MFYQPQVGLLRILFSEINRFFYLLTHFLTLFLILPGLSLWKKPREQPSEPGRPGLRLVFTIFNQLTKYYEENFY
jgi:hypothetical protein